MQWTESRRVPGRSLSCQLPSPLLWSSSPLRPEPRPWGDLQPQAGRARSSHGEHWKGSPASYCDSTSILCSGLGSYHVFWVHKYETTTEKVTNGLVRFKGEESGPIMHGVHRLRWTVQFTLRSETTSSQRWCLELVRWTVESVMMPSSVPSRAAPPSPAAAPLKLLPPTGTLSIDHIHDWWNLMYIQWLLYRTQNPILSLISVCSI